MTSFITNTPRRVSTPEDDKPKSDKTWLVLTAFEERFAGSLKGAQFIAREEAKRNPGSKVVVYEAVEAYTAPVAEIEVVTL